jgi:hypothetical protein
MNPHPSLSQRARVESGIVLSPAGGFDGMAKILRRPLFVISSAARNLRSLTFVRDDNATFADCETVFFE